MKPIALQHAVAHGLLLFAMIMIAGCAEEKASPWWIEQTAMDDAGRLDLKKQPWWNRASVLKPGEYYDIEEVTNAGEMRVRCERTRNVSEEVDAIVLIIDDDGDRSTRDGGDLDSDCYVVDYDRDGLVDRMVDYIDDDGDNDPDEMDIRYFENGELRSVWIGVDVDDDSSMWDLKGYEYSHEFFKSDPYGQGMLYMN